MKLRLHAASNEVRMASLRMLSGGVVGRACEVRKCLLHGILCLLATTADVEYLGERHDGFPAY